MNLFEINSEIRMTLNEVFESVDEETGEVREDLVKRLNELQQDRDTKLENITLYLKEKQKEAEALKEEARKLQERARMASNAAERLKVYLINGMNEADLKKFETSRVKLAFRKTTRVVVEDILSLDNEFVKVETVADKTAIKKAISAGQCVNGAFLEEGESLVIK